MKSNRLVNIEILRIIAMLLVLFGHYVIPYYGNVNQEMVHTDLWKAIGIAESKSWSFVCVPSFVIISGYFGIHWKWKSFINYLFQIAFWGGIIYLITFVLGMHDFVWPKLFKNIFCSMWGVNWFFSAYLGLYMLAPIINAYVEKSSEKELLWMLLAFICFQTFYGWIIKVNEFREGLTTTSLLGYYMLGAYLKKTTLKYFHWNATVNFCVFLGIGFFCVIVNCVTQYLGATKDIYSYISPLQILQTAYLFLFCKSLSIKNEKIANIILFFSSSAFAGLLMHSWEGADIYYNVLNYIYVNVNMPVIVSLLWIVLFFMMACVLDKIRLFVWKKVVMIFCK